jgi:hypothetical protein
MGGRTMAKCKSCGSEIPEGTKFCGKCGTPLQQETGDSALKCGKCGRENPAASKFCTGCGAPLGQASEVGAQPSAIRTDFSGLPTYYQEEFKKILDSKESYKGKWNWAAFFLTFIWAFSKGAWGSGIGFLVFYFFLPYVSADMGINLSFLLIIVHIIYGLRGNYIYYNVYVKKRQWFWQK